MLAATERFARASDCIRKDPFTKWHVVRSSRVFGVVSHHCRGFLLGEEHQERASDYFRLRLPLPPVAPCSFISDLMEHLCLLFFQVT